MAQKLPMIDEPQEKTRPLPTVPQEPLPESAFGSLLLGIAGMRTARDVGQIAARAKQTADVHAVAGLEDEFAKRIQPVIIDPETGFMAQQGKNALNVRPYTDELSKIRDDVAKKATNEDQKEAFMRRADERLDIVNRQIMQHSINQRQKYFSDQRNSTMSSTLEMAKIFYSDLEGVDKLLDQTQKVLVTSWAEAGHDAQMILQEWGEYESTVKYAVVDEYFKRNDGIGAQKAIERYGDSLGVWRGTAEGRVRPIVEKQLGSQMGRQLYKASYGQGGLAPDAPSQMWVNAQIQHLMDGLTFRPESVEGGTPVDLTRAVINNPDGSISTERTRTYEVDGKFYVIPTVVNGEDVGGAKALELFKAGANPAVGTFDSEAKATDYAQKRSAYIGRVRGTNPVTYEVLKIAQAEADDLFNGYKQAYDRDSTAVLGDARRTWEENGHRLGSIDENTKQNLMSRWDQDGTNLWTKMTIMDRQYREAMDPNRQPATLEERLALVNWYKRLATAPHSVDNWTIEDFRKNVGVFLHGADVESAGAAWARTLGRPDKLTVGIAPMIKMFETIGSQSGLFPKPSDTGQNGTKDWKPDEIQAYYWGIQQLQDWLAVWHKDDKINKGREVPSIDEYQPFIEGLFAPGNNPDKIFGGTTRIQAEVSGTRFEPDTSKIPFEFRRAFKTRWAERYNAKQVIDGVPPPDHEIPTEAEIAEGYVRQLRIGKAKPGTLSTPRERAEGHLRVGTITP